MTVPIRRITPKMVDVLSFTYEANIAGRATTARDIGQGTGYRLATVYPILSRFQNAGWVERVEKADDDGFLSFQYVVTDHGRRVLKILKDENGKRSRKKLGVLQQVRLLIPQRAAS